MSGAPGDADRRGHGKVQRIGRPRGGPRLLSWAAAALLSLGRRAEAGQLVAQAFELDLESPAERQAPLITRGYLRLWDGDLAAAHADFGQVLEESPAPLDPVGAAEVLCGLAEVALWDGRLPDGRTAVADGLTALAAAEEPYWITRLCRTGLAIEAQAAGHPRGRPADGEDQAARERAAGLVDRIRSAVSAPGVVLTPRAGRHRGHSRGRVVAGRRPQRPRTMGQQRRGLGGAQPPLAVGVRPLAAGRGAAGRAGAARRRPHGPGPSLDAGQHARRCPAGHRDPGAGPPGQDRAPPARTAARPDRGEAGPRAGAPHRRRDTVPRRDQTTVLGVPLTIRIPAAK